MCCREDWQPARRLVTAAVCGRSLPSYTTKAPCLAYTYARIPAVLLMNRAGLHFLVTHPQAAARREGTPIVKRAHCKPGVSGAGPARASASLSNRPVIWGGIVAGW